MATERKIILVTGATGRQGGAVVRHLASSPDWHVRALTRDPAKRSAQELQNLGAEVVQGDLGDVTTLSRPIEGAYGVFSVQDFWEAGYEREVEQGKNLADIAKAAGVKHFVYSSVGGAERSTGIPHFDSKWEVEEHIRSLDLTWTIFRPVFFMDNFSTPDMRTSIMNGTISLALPADYRLQMIAVDDIGGFAALAFNDRDRFLHQAHEIAGDEPAMKEVAEKFARALDRRVEYKEMPIEQMRSMNEEYAVMLEWFVQEGYKADIPKLREMYSGLKSFDDWLSTEADWVRGGLLLEEAIGT